LRPFADTVNSRVTLLKRDRARTIRRLSFAVSAAALGVAVAALALLAADVYAHHRFERGVLYNVWGYRGPTIGRKSRGEYRIAVLGGSAAYGFGVRWEESMPVLLEQRLAAERPRVRVVNLAYNGQGAYAFVPTLDDYAYLKPDLALLYESYNDLLSGPPNPTHLVFRRESAIFRLTGYLPVFPIVAREKASVLLYGDTRQVYRYAPHAQTVFRPGLARRAGADALRSAAAVGEALERQFDRVVAEAGATPPSEHRDTGACKGTWVEYCSLVRDAVHYARDHGLQVLVVSQPYALGEQLRAAHVQQQGEVADMLTREFAGDGDVAYVNLGERVDLSDPQMAFDRMHLTADGNARIADALIAPVRALKLRRIRP
jgi:hypothetical protein